MSADIKIFTDDIEGQALDQCHTIAKSPVFATARTGSGRYWGRWTSEQLHEVMAHKQSDRELSKRIGRSVSAIQTARYRVRRGPVSIPGYDPSMDALIPLSEPNKERSDS